MKRLLMLTHRLPYPPDKGERVRAFEALRALSSRFDIVLASLSESRNELARAADGLRPWCRQVLAAPLRRKLALCRGACRLAMGGSVTEGYFASRRLSRLVLDEACRQPFDIVLGYSSGMLPLALRVPAAGRVMDLVDADSAKWRSYSRAGRGMLSWAYQREAQGVAALEQQAVRQCHAVLLISQAEVAALGIRSERLMAVGNGVDAAFFDPAAPFDDTRGEGDKSSAGSPENEGRADEQSDSAGGRLVFTGTMNYRPNVEGIGWFVEHVWPAVRRLRPACQLQIVGRNPTPAVWRLADAAGVEVTGAVADVRPYLRQASLAVAPLRIARGVQNKVLEAMAMARPVVASSAAMEGLEVEAGRHLLRADSPQEWVRAVDQVLNDPAAAREFGRRARQCVLERYSWPSRMSPLVELCCRLSQQAVGDAASAIPTTRADRAGHLSGQAEAEDCSMMTLSPNGELGGK